MNTDVHFSSANPNWETPQKLYDYWNREYKFSLDAACTSKNCLAPDGFYFDKGQDALKLNWAAQCWLKETPNKNIFLNSPYGRGVTEKWVKKAFEESEDVTVVCLLPARPDTNWFMRYCMHGDVYFIAGRLKFYDPDKPDHKRKYDKNGNEILDPAPFPSCIVIFGPDVLPHTTYWPESRGMFD